MPRVGTLLSAVRQVCPIVSVHDAQRYKGLILKDFYFRCAKVDFTMIRSAGEKASRGTVGFSIHASAGESGHVTDVL